MWAKGRDIVMSEIVDVSKFVLNKDELRLLKKIRKRGVITVPKGEARLIEGKGLTMFVQPITNSEVSLKLSETGERYFTYKKQVTRENRITRTIAIVALIISVVALMLPYIAKPL